ncbi:4-hydroxy-tetrahydrodipicolinate reductase [Halarsenatibacter silvermanii]|uniref:4-hydroxy-tetrahydrodipicolinate reductase n=2 Tax=Halarsenatibacter silvermanii TaxID=321763 RepID=A0A1G9QRI7_9FIRM|nr:4-hydroxy-tetrahydrodipicolinate reductase [Halarsenatibacter silvermanii]
MGSGMGRLLAERSDLKISGGIASREGKSGIDIGELLELEQKLGVEAVNDPSRAITEETDVVLNATSSSIVQVEEEIKFALRKSCNVISIAEEMAYPEVAEPEIAFELDQIAEEKGVSLLGTGINPGFILDLLVIALTGACLRVEKITARRINDLSPFGPTVMKTQGVGTTVDEFNRGVEKGEIVGHIGFKESISMIADRLEWDIDEVEESREPIISDVARSTEHVRVEPGMVAGCRHTARAFKNGNEIIVLRHPQQICPEKAGIETGDYIEIKGDPGIDMAITPEIPGGKGTIAVSVNMIPLVLKAEPGLKTMTDLPVPSALPEDISGLL